jgi:MFS family permease
VSNNQSKVYTNQFWLVCISSALFFASFNMLIPELPAFITSLDGADYKGLIISLFTVTAMISRPFSGKLADTIGRIPVMVFGAAVCIFCSMIYPILTSLSGFFLLRFVHGFSTGFTPTGQAAYLSDVIPENRRGEAMGFLGTAGMIGMAGGPAVGGLVTRLYGLTTTFYLSSLFALIAASILISTRETLKEKRPFSLSILRINTTDVFEPRVLLPCLIMALSMYAFGAVLTLLPDFGESLGVRNKELLFTCFTVASLVIRFIAGKASDRFGRVPVLIASTALTLAAMLLMAIADSPALLMVGVAAYGLAQGATSPTLLAWTTDLSDSHHRGRALASVYIFMEIGIGLGAFFSGWIFANDSTGFFVPFLVCGVFGGLAFALLLLRPSTAVR